MKLSLRLQKLFSLAVLALFLIGSSQQTEAQSVGKQIIKGHVPEAAATAPFLGHLSGSKTLNLAIALPLRNQDQLNDLLKAIYDRKSPQYRHYLKMETFTEMFGPSQQDYQTLVNFIQSKGLTVTKTHPNRMLVEVSGAVSDIEKTFHVTLNRYQRPDGSEFHAPDVEPSIDLDVPVLHVAGLENYGRPKPASTSFSPNQARPQAGGSGPYGLYTGLDIYRAYASNVGGSAAGQRVGLVEFSNYYASDISLYENSSDVWWINNQTKGASYPPPSLRNVYMDGVTPSTPPDPNYAPEATLDIDMAMVFPVNLSEVVVYEGEYLESILNAMATDPNPVYQISCSYGWPTADAVWPQLLEELAAQGQSFFQASGDYGSYPNNFYTTGLPSPQDLPYVTVVGGTELTMGGTPPYTTYAGETVWNNPNEDRASGGGISSDYAIPDYQQAVNMTTNLGSTTMRNVPDVALVADNILIYDSTSPYGSSSAYGTEHQAVGMAGTSAAAPLWAGFMAMVNARLSQPVGFANPAIYAIGQTPTSYANDFHDITSVNNYIPNNGTNTIYSTGANGDYPAVTGYDLATGWGSPTGQSLINDLVGQTLSFTPTPTPIFCYSNQWGQQGTLPGQFNQPRYVAVFGSNMYVSDTANNRIQVYNTVSQTWTAWGGTAAGSGNGQFNKPMQIAVDASGNLYVADQGNNRVQVLNPNGQTLMNFGSQGTGNGQFVNPTALGVDTNGYIYVSDLSNSRIEKFNPQGVYLAQWGTSGTGNGQFGTVYSLTIDGSNNVYTVDAANSNVQKFSCIGTTVTELANWGQAGTGNGQFEYPLGIAVGPCGYIYVGSGNGTIENIQAFTETGKYVGQYAAGVGSGNGQFNDPFWGLTFDASNNLYVADMLNDRIEEFSPCGLLCEPTPTPTPLFCYSGCQWGSQGTGNSNSSSTYFNLANGIAFNPVNSTIYVSDQGAGNHGVQEFNLSSGCWSFVGNLGSGKSQFGNPAQIAIDGYGNVYVVDPTLSSVQMFNSSGVYQMQFGSSGTGNGQFHGPAGVAVNSAGTTVYVCDSGNDRIQYFSISGGSGPGGIGSGATANYQGQYPNGSLHISIINPSELAFDGTYVYVADTGYNTLVKLSATLNYLSGWGAPVYAGNDLKDFSAPPGVAVGPCGNIYVTDGNNRVQIFNSNLVYQGAYNSVGNGSLNGQLNGPIGLTFDGSNDMYVVDSGNYRVEEFTACGISCPATPTPTTTPTPTSWISCNPVNSWSAPSYNTPSNNVMFPWGVALDASGNVYVADDAADLVDVFNPTGGQGPVASIGAGQTYALTQPMGVAVAGQTGYVYVTDNVQYTVDIYNNLGSPEGQWLGLAGTQPNPQTGELQGPQGIAVNSMGTSIYVAVPGLGGVGLYSTAGALQTGVGLYEPVGVALDNSGNVWMTDADTGWVFEYDPTLTYLGNNWSAYNPAQNSLMTAEFITVDNCQVYVSDGWGTVAVFTESGTFLGETQGGTVPFINTEGLAVDNNGLYVANLSPDVSIENAALPTPGPYQNSLIEQFVNCPVPICTFPPTPTYTPTAIGTNTFTSTYTPTPTNTRTFTITPTGTKTDTVTLTPTVTKTPTYTRTPTNSFTWTKTQTITNTRTITSTPTVTKTRTYTRTPTNSFTWTKTPTITNTRTVTATPTATKTTTSTFTRTHTVTPTFSKTPTIVGGAAQPLESGKLEGNEPQTTTPTLTPATLLNGSSNLVAAWPNISKNGQPIRFQFHLGTPAQIKLSLFTLTGEQVYQVSLAGGNGATHWTWNLQNRSEKDVASGLYIYAVEVNDGTSVKTMLGKFVILH